MDEIIHRKAKIGHALCGKKITPQECTLDDKAVNCPECLKILNRLQSTDTQIFKQVLVDGGMLDDQDN